MDEALKEAVEQIEKAVQNEKALRVYYNIQIKKMEIENQIQGGKEERELEIAAKLKIREFILK